MIRYYLRHGSPFLLHPFDWISSELGWEDAPRARMSFSVSPTHQAHASRGRAGATLNFWAPAEQSLIDDLAANADLRANAVQEELYPMYVMRVRELLQLDAWRPHQQLLSDGLLVRVTEEVAKSATIVFVSHQWTSFSHPDPTGAQLLALQGALSKLLSGELTVRADSILQLVYNYHRETGPAEWKQLLESGCVWLDFVSMPQPMAGDSTHQRASSDHRLAADGDPSSTVVSNLRNAVASIPSYVERCSMMWAFVPSVTHTDLEGSVCDFNSWCRRGWCRMELAAATLAHQDIPVLVVSCGSTAPQYICPATSIGLPAAKGIFTVESDREVVLGVLQSMLAAKVHWP